MTWTFKPNIGEYPEESYAAIAWKSHDSDIRPKKEQSFNSAFPNGRYPIMYVTVLTTASCITP